MRMMLLRLAFYGCFLIMFFGIFICVIGAEAITTGINPGPWLWTFGALIVAPAICAAVIFFKVRKERRE